MNTYTRYEISGSQGVEYEDFCLSFGFLYRVVW
jgi:hypothetical protein